MSGQSFDDSDQLGRQSASPPCSPNQWPLPPTSEARVAAGGQAPVSGWTGQGQLACQAVGGKRSWWWRRPANGPGPDGGGAPAVENPDDAALAGSNGAG